MWRCADVQTAATNIDACDAHDTARTGNLNEGGWQGCLGLVATFVGLRGGLQPNERSTRSSIQAMRFHL